MLGLTNGRLSFDAWETSKTFNVRANMDDDTDDETLNLGFGALPSGVVQGSPSSATLTIEETNVPPTFDEGMDTTRSVAENTASNTDIGVPVSATDADNDPLMYSLSGDDAGSFTVVDDTGQIRTSDPLDFEIKQSYSVTVNVDDGKGGTDSIVVIVTVTDVNEAPVGQTIGSRILRPDVVSHEIDLSLYFSDPDTNDTLGYSASSSDTGVVTASVSGSALTLERVSAGAATITVTAADRSAGDAERLTASQDFTVTVEAAKPEKPANLKAEHMIGGRGVKLEWQPADGAAGYEVEISPTETAHQIKITGSSAEVTGLIPETTYTFEVLACDPCGASGVFSLPSDGVRIVAPKPRHWWGHQADHSVKYVVDRNIGNSVITNAISPAVSAWNFAMARLGKGLKICASTDSNCVNPDGYTVTIKTVDNNNDSIGRATLNQNEGCGSSRACVKPVGLGGDNESLAPGAHMENIYMVFEDPPWFAQMVRPAVWRLREYVWTKDKYKDGKLVPCLAASSCAFTTPRYYVHAGRIMLHEFGHTLGLPDFYSDTTTGLDGFRNQIKLPNAAILQSAVMHTGFVINGEDMKQLEAIYLLHDAH